MGEHFIKEIEIKDYKCFKNFKADGFARVNLIGGKNNVGKTAFMEACYIHLEAEDVMSFAGAMAEIKTMRENINLLDALALKKIEFNKELYIEYFEKFSGLNISINSVEKSFCIYIKDGLKEYEFLIGEKNVKINANDFSFSSIKYKNINFIDNFGLSNANIISDFSAIQAKEKENFLNDIINKFDNKIESFKIMIDKPKCKMDGEYYELTEFGDGLRHLISIVIELFRCENGNLFIDEIDNGIHYTQLDDIWKIILEVSKTLNVQVFATTHSKECIESYARVSNELKDDDISLIELGKDKQDNLKAIVMNNQRFQRELKNGNGVRGW